jgi:hypothetical protein
MTSAIGTSRHLAAARYFGRFRGDADINRADKTPGSVENDPERKSSSLICCVATSCFRHPGLTRYDTLFQAEAGQ